MNKNYEELIALIPETDEEIDWDKIENSFLSPLVESYKNTHQRLDYHGEDDVWTHTKMVTEALTNIPDYKKLDRKLQQALFTAALFHDLGKVYTTIKEDGEWTSPFHAKVGAEKFNELAINELGIEDSTPEKEFQDLVSILIANHVKPMHALKKKDPKKELLKLLENKKISPEFTLELLSILVEADMTGRISVDKEKSLNTIKRFRDYAKKENLFN